MIEGFFFKDNQMAGGYCTLCTCGVETCAIREILIKTCSRKPWIGSEPTCSGDV
jgi:hypothetical protein